MRRRFRLFLAIFAAAHVYIWWRLAWPLPSPGWQIGTALIAVGGPALPVTFAVSQRLARPARRACLLAGYLWFGLAAYLLIGALASHLAVGFGATARDAAIAGGAGAAAVVVLGLLHVARGPLVKRVRVALDRLPVDRYTIVHLTDVHVGTIIGRGFVETVVRRVNALRPDLVVITGDLVDGPLAELRPHVEPLRGLRARDGVYAVTGNHEYYWNAEPWLAHLASLGVRVLRNEHVTISDPSGPVLQLAGTDDCSAGEDVPGAVRGADPARPLILLAHHPRTIARAAAAGVDLQLSGHTHGGQLLPWGYLARLWDPKVAGLARFGRTWLYVSDGTGFWGPPLRVGTSCEIAAITLVPSRT